MPDWRILDFDIENRPLAYLGQDFTTAEITAISACWAGEEQLHTWLLGEVDAQAMLSGFRALYDAADIVTGHYIREHDLPVVNGAMMEYWFPALDQKMTVDTKIDLVHAKYISKSQENLAAMLGLGYEKAHMSNAAWREANRLTPSGLALTKARVEGDVRQHMALYRILAQRRFLSEPKVWRP